MSQAVEQYQVKIGARAIVTRRTDAGTFQLLIGQRPANSTLDAGKWSLPGGKPELEEDMITCAARELHEETGLMPQAAELVHVEHDWYDGALVISFFVFIAEWSGEVTSQAGQEQWQWCDVGELPDNFMANTQKFLDSPILPYILHAQDTEHDDDCGDCE